MEVIKALGMMNSHSCLVEATREKKEGEREIHALLAP
jgi:hypothetical protein